MGTLFKHLERQKLAPPFDAKFGLVSKAWALQEAIPQTLDHDFLRGALLEALLGYVGITSKISVRSRLRFELRSCGMSLISSPSMEVRVVGWLVGWLVVRACGPGRGRGKEEGCVCGGGGGGGDGVYDENVYP